jgi:hypothetical protein
MPNSKDTYSRPSKPPSCVVREDTIEYGFIGKLQSLKYEYREDICDRAALEKNFRERFEALNRVKLTEAEFARLLDEIVTPDVFTAAKTLRSINAFIHAFEQAAPMVATVTQTVLTCRGKGVSASGFEATQGFVVRSGSQAVGESVPSMQQHVRGMFDLRQELIGNGVLQREDDHYRFDQDYVFTSPSTAAAVVLGRSANGRLEWKDAGGRTLKALQELEARA